MAETVGRVDFIAGLDGRNLAREAKRIGREIGEAGDDAGKDFGDKFESSFQRRLSDFGRDFADDLGRKGRLAGTSFSNSVDSTLQSRFRRMQSNLADILTDEAAFANFARGFDSVGDAVDRAADDLEELSNQTYKYRDQNGKLREKLVLTEQDLHRATLALREMGDVTQAQVDKEERFAETQRRLARETEELNAQWTRLTRTVGDRDAFAQAAERMGGIEEAHRKLRREIEVGGNAMGRTRAEIETYVDRLDITRDRALRVAAAVAEADREHNRFGRTLGNLANIASKPWQNLDNDVRLVVGLIAAAADQIAALGSAAGAGLISVGSTVGALGVGLSGVVPVFLALNREVEDLPAHMRDVADEFSGFKQGFKETAAVISQSAFRQLPGVFDSLGSSLRVLDPEFAALGNTVGDLGLKLARSLEPGSDGLREIQQFIRESTPLFEDLAESAGTLGGSLVRSFNRANPLTQQFVGYIDKLITRFDDFSRSTEFDAWVRNASLIWTDFGELLDATGEALNDLGNPSSVQNLRELMDELTEFMPKLATGLNVVGELNILGLVAEALNGIADALEPLADPLYDLFGALNDVAGVLIGELSEAFGVVAAVVAPVVQGLADFLNALPPEAVEAMADAVILLGGAFLFAKGVGSIATAAQSLGLFSTAAGVAATSAKDLQGKLSGIAGKAGIWGLVAVGAFAAGEAIQNFVRDLEGVDDVAADAVAKGGSLQDVYGKVGFAFSGASNIVDQFAIGLRQVSGTTQGFISDTDDVIARMSDFGNVFTRSFAGFDAVGSDAIALSNSLKELDEPLSSLAATDLSAATAQFSGYAAELGASKEQVLVLLNEMPGFKQALIDAAQAEDGLASDADLVALALGGATGSARTAKEVLAELEGKSVETGTAIDGLADKIRNFGTAELDTREAARGFQESLQALTDSVAANGTSLDITTAAGRANEAALDDIATSALELAAATYEQTGKQDDATVAIANGRQALLDQLAVFGITGAEADAYADKLGLIPGNVDTIVNTPGLGAAEEGARRMNDSVRRIPTSWSTTYTFIGKQVGDVFPKTAVGGTFYGSQIREIAEDGPEAVVPLNRPLNQVDPSVRMLSAIAQGKLSYPVTSGADERPSVTFAEGSIVIEGVEDPRQAALEVQNAVAELIGS